MAFLPLRSFYPDVFPPPTLFLLSLTHFIITHNNFTFNSLYRVKGTAMGTSGPPPMLICSWVSLEEDFLNCSWVSLEEDFLNCSWVSLDEDFLNCSWVSLEEDFLNCSWVSLEEDYLNSEDYKPDL